jgi:hypothetical protein
LFIVGYLDETHNIDKARKFFYMVIFYSIRTHAVQLVLADTKQCRILISLKKLGEAASEVYNKELL